MHVLYPEEVTSSYTGIKGKYHTTTETVYKPIVIDVLNTRYGRIKLEEKDTNPGKRQTYKQCETYLTQVLEGPLHTNDMWNFYTVVNMPIKDNDKEEYLYEVVDTLTGYVLVKTFKHSAKRFIDQFIKDGFYFCGEEEAEIDRWYRDEYKVLQRKIEKKLVGVYASGMKTIRSYRKYAVEKD